MRFLTLILAITIFQSCSTQEKETSETNVDEELEKPSEIAIQLDRDKIRKMNASTARIAKKIQEVIFDSTSTYKGSSLEELKQIEIEFKNNEGKLIRIPLGELIDTAYYQ